MSEPGLDIRNTGNAHCMICNTPCLCQYDKDLFFRKLDFEQFLPEANRLGYKVPHADFTAHLKHIYVYKKPDLKAEASPIDVVSGMINSLRTQLAAKEEAGETGDTEYTKKSELLKSLIELKGKFDGSYARSSDTSTSFKELLEGQIKNALVAEATKINKIAEKTSSPEQDNSIFADALAEAAKRKAGEKL